MNDTVGAWNHAEGETTVMKMRVSWAVTALMVLVGLSFVSPQGREASADPRQIVVVSNSICAALTATRALGSDAPAALQACLVPSGAGGLLGLRTVEYPVSSPAPHPWIVAALATQVNGLDDSYATTAFGLEFCESGGSSPEPDDIEELLCSLDARDGSVDGSVHLRAGDFSGIDLDGDQFHEKDGALNFYVFVDDDDPVKFDAPSQFKWRESGTGDFVCAGSIDEDCDSDGVGGDSLVAGQLLRSDAVSAVSRGTKAIRVIQSGTAWDYPVRVVGEPDKIELAPLKTAFAATGLPTSLSDVNPAQLACPLAASVEGFMEALGNPTKSVILARVYDDDGNAVTGAFVSWKFDDNNKAVIATGVTPTLDLGGFGFGAPNIACGSTTGGTARLTAATMSVSEQAVQLGIGLESQGEAESTSSEFSIGSMPAALALTSEPAVVACDGASVATVKAAASDKSGNPVGSGFKVKFDVRVLGTANPLTAATDAAGVATTKVTALSGSASGVPVVASVYSPNIKIDVDEDGVRASIAETRGVALDAVPTADVTAALNRLAPLEGERLLAQASTLVKCGAGAPAVAPLPPPPGQAPSGAAGGVTRPPAGQPGLPRSGEGHYASRTTLPGLGVVLLSGLALLVGSSAIVARRRAR